MSAVDPTLIVLPIYTALRCALEITSMSMMNSQGLVTLERKKPTVVTDANTS